MSSIIKYAALIFLAVILITVGVLYFEYVHVGKFSAIAEQPHSIENVSKQYNVSFSFNGDRSQIIDLIKGNAELNLVYSDSSRFSAKLLNTDGTLLVKLADQYGPYNEKQIVIIPETGAYLLDVKTKGEWSLNKD